MPYIEQGVRASLDDGRGALKPGELNYKVSKAVNDYFAMRGLSYTVINEVIGALECAKMEVYRKLAANYEDRKEIENGTVWTGVTQ